MSVAGAEGVVLGAYWSDRPETAGRCAARLLSLIERLEAIDPLFTGWFAARTAAPLPRDPAAVTELLLADREHGIDGTPVPDAGCSLVVLSGPAGAGAGLSVRCGGYAGIPGLRNSVVLEPLRGIEGSDVWVGEAERLVTAVIEAWEPDWAVLGPSSFRSAQRDRADAPHVGALTYLSEALGTVPALPDDVRTTRTARGWMLSLIDSGRLPEIERVLRLARALDEAGYARSGDGEREAPTLDVLNVDQREESLAYQERVTGVARGRVYRVHDVDFAAYDGETLVATVGPGYSTFFRDDVARACVAARLLDRADREVWAAGRGQPIEWRVAEPDVAAEVDSLLADGGFGHAVRVRPQTDGASTSLLLGAYWGDRWESHETSAARLRSMVDGLAAVDPLFERWWLLRAGRLPVPLPRDPMLLPDLVLSGRRRRDGDGAAIRELGFVLTAAYGHERPAARVHVRCGQEAGTPGILNTVLVEPFRHGHPNDVWLRRSEAIVRAVVGAWEPDWAVLGPRSFRDAQSPGDREPHVGAVTYLADWLGGRPALPADVGITRLPEGMLVSLIRGDALPDLERVVATARALRAVAVLSPLAQAHPVR